jgi:uncharacterized protein
MSLIIATGRLRQKKEIISGEEPSASLQIDGSELAEPQGPLIYDLTVQRFSNELVVQGKLKMNFTCRCARCGDSFTRKILIPDFSRNFCLASQNELINLTPDVREDILLALPMVAVCSADCRGLCTACGMNLNHGKCKCRKQAAANAWQALDGLRLK